MKATKTQNRILSAVHGVFAVGVLLVAGTIPARAQHITATPPVVAPALAGSGVWINGEPTTIAAQRGKVVLLAFWTHQCINCKRTIPYWNRWARKYAGASDVAVLSVHTPETESERKVDNVRRFVKERGIAFSVVTDNDYKTWNAFGVQAWPTTLLIDKQGRIRDRWEGELNWQNSGAYQEVEKRIAALRQER